MATTLTSSITQIDIPRLKRDLEAVGNVRVVSITPPSGATLTTVTLTQSDRVSPLSPSQASACQVILDNHIDYIDESAQEVALARAVIGTIAPGVIDFINDGLVWQIDSSKNFIPIGVRNIGSPTHPVNRIYVNEIVGPGGTNNSIFNEVPVGAINGANIFFTTASNFVSGSTRLFLNGIKLRSGASFDYQETSPNEITLAQAPLAGDSLIIEYSEAL